MTALSASVDGIVSSCSSRGQSATIARVLASLAKHHVPLVARIDHAAAADAAGLALPPTELLIFGKPNAGTPLMAAESTVAIDLPLKLLVHRRPDGCTWLSYTDPAWIARRHHLAPEYSRIIVAMRELLADIVRDATVPG